MGVSESLPAVPHDLDLLTGHGRSGIGLRFDARDWIEDELRGTHSLITIGGLQIR